ARRATLFDEAATMARSRPEKPKGKPETAPPQSTSRVLPMELRIGDRLVDATAEWEIIGRPYTTNAGKDAHARVGKVSQPDVVEVRNLGAHEKVSVKRATAEEGKR